MLLSTLLLVIPLPSLIVALPLAAPAIAPSVGTPANDHTESAPNPIVPRHKLEPVEKAEEKSTPTIQLGFRAAPVIPLDSVDSGKTDTVTPQDPSPHARRSNPTFIPDGYQDDTVHTPMPPSSPPLRHVRRSNPTLIPAGYEGDGGHEVLTPMPPSSPPLAHARRWDHFTDVLPDANHFREGDHPAELLDHTRRSEENLQMREENVWNVVPDNVKSGGHKAKQTVKNILKRNVLFPSPAEIADEH